MVFDTDAAIFATVLGSLLAMGIGMVIQFFAFHVDYTRVEKVQFEDEEN